MNSKIRPHFQSQHGTALVFILLPSLLSTPALGFSARHRKTPADSLKNISGQILSRDEPDGRKGLLLGIVYNSLNRLTSLEMPIKSFPVLKICITLISTYRRKSLFVVALGWVYLFIHFLFCFEAVPSCFPSMALNSSVQMIFLLQPVDQLTPQAHAFCYPEETV